MLLSAPVNAFHLRAKSAQYVNVSSHAVCNSGIVRLMSRIRNHDQNLNLTLTSIHVATEPAFF